MRTELAYALRTLRREPAFVFGVVCTFALAIGTNAAMFGLVTRLMLAPPPGIRDAERVMRLQLEVAAGEGRESFRMSTTSYPAFLLFAAQQRAFSATAALRPDSAAVGRGADLDQVSAIQASGDYFKVLGVTAAAGRLFGPDDDALPVGNSVVVLSHAYWKRHFGGDPAVVGRELIVEDQPFTIIGVTPSGFNGDQLSAVDLFIPLTAALRFREFGWWTNDRMNLVHIIVRLADGVTPSVAAQIATTALDDKRRVIRLEPVVPGQSSRDTPQARIALWLSGVSLIVLLIATANVGTLLLLRAARRRRDLAVRLALGAGHGAIARQLVLESVLLAITGAAAGLLLSRWFDRVLRVTLLPALASADGFIDRRVFIATIVVACVAGLLAGLSPLTQLRRMNVSHDLRSGGHGASGRFAFQNLLVGVQVALCTVLLIGAGLFVRSLERVQSQDLGFRTTDLIHVTLDFKASLSGAERDLAHEDALRRIRGVRGVNSATVVQAMPFGNFHVPPISIPGLAEWPTVDGQPPFLYGATPDYLRMMRVTAREGRLFEARDTMRSSLLVVLVNESMARNVWPGESALGKCVRAGHGFAPGEGFGNPAESLPCREVIGVVRDSRARSLRADGNETKFMQYYVPFQQLPAPPFSGHSRISGLLVQVAGDEDATAALIQRTIQSSSVVPVYARVRSYQDLLDPQLRSWRLGAALFTAFGLLALGIAAVGLFGVVSYLISQRTREIGVRLAIGATPAKVWRMVVQDALRLVAAGLAIGMVGALAAGPLVRDLLFQTAPWEPANLAAAVCVLLAVTVMAAFWPAWRAGRVNPLEAFRTDA